MTPQLISKDRVLEIARDAGWEDDGGEVCTVYCFTEAQLLEQCAALEAELLERLGQWFEEYWRDEGLWLPQNVCGPKKQHQNTFNAGAIAGAANAMKQNGGDHG